MRPAVRRTLVGAVVLVAAVAGWFLHYGGRYLQHEDPLQKADAIFILGGTRAERLLEGYDLYREGYAPVIVVSPGRPERSERLLQARGLHFPVEADLQRDALVGLGVPPEKAMVLGGYVDNTAKEAELLRQFAPPRGWRRVIVVTSKYHTRRTGVAFRRAFAGTGVTTVVRASRYDDSNPANWWRTRADVRFVLFEWEKLIAYRVGLGG